MSAHERIPYALVLFRVILAPLFPIGYALDAAPWVYVTLLVAGIISDVFDGVLARRWKTVTPQLRRCDSNADLIFLGMATITAVLLHSAYLAPWRWAFAVMFVFIIAQNVVNVIRFGRQPAYHMWSGKLWSIVFVTASIGLFLNHPSDGMIDLLIGLSIYSSIENIIASLVLPKPMTDVPTVVHALRLAKHLASSSAR